MELAGIETRAGADHHAPALGLEGRGAVPAAVGVGADGLMVEVHPDPNHALSDGAQSLYPDQFRELVDQIRVIAQAIDRELAPTLTPRGEAS